MAEKYVNGIPLPTAEDRSANSFRATKGNIVAIDFGTTSCSVAYLLKDTSEIRYLKIDNTNCRVPTAVLIDPTRTTVVAFGDQARNRYYNLPAADRTEYYYYHQIKMYLQHEEVIGRNITAKATNGKELFLVEVIAMILKYLKHKLLQSRQSSALPLGYTVDDFDWVITVPAMWKARGKQMMREAAYKAGIGSKKHEIYLLTEVARQSGNFTCLPASVHDPTNPEMLSLALESEAAAFYCMKELQQSSKCYMILDIGGGTVDITAHEITECGAVKVIIPPTGNAWGGTTVNAGFMKFLGTLVNDQKFERMLSVHDLKRQAKNQGTLEEIKKHLFEQQKRFFGDQEHTSDEVVVKLPFVFMTTYATDLKEGIEKLKDSQVSLDDNELRLSYNKVADFFEPALKEIKPCVIESLQKISQKVDMVLFVGGFGGCKYLHDKLEAEIKEAYDDRCRTYRPLNHELAVVSGAVLFRQNPALICARVADATYGVRGTLKFNPSIHNLAYRFYDDDGNAMCNHLFVPFVEKGDIVYADQLLVQCYTPLYHHQKDMKFCIYSSDQRQISYVLDPDGNPLSEVQQIGTLSVEILNTTKDLDRRIKLTFDFTHTEIQIQAFDISSGQRTVTTADFLTDHTCLQSNDN